MCSHLLGFGRPACAVALGAAALLVSTATPRAATTETFVPTTIHYPGATATSARGINDSGDIVGTFSCAAACTNPLNGEISTAGVHGFLRRDGAYTRIDVPGGVATTPRGVSQQGTIVGHYNAAGLTHGFVYANGNYIYPIDVPARLFDDPSSPARHTLPVRMSPQGDIVGCFHEGNLTMTTMHGWLLRNGEFTALATPHFPGDTSRDPDTMNNGVAPTGDIVGFYFTDGVSYIADQNGIASTFTVEGRFTLAWDVNARGDIVGVVGENAAMTVGSAVNPRGFLITRDGDHRVLAVQGATNTQIIGINSRGDIVGQFTAPNIGTRGFLYRVKRGNE